MNYPVLKISLLSQAVSVVIHTAVIVGGGLIFMHPARFGMDAGQGGALGLSSRRVLQAEIQVVQPQTERQSTEAERPLAQDLQNELSQIPDPDSDMASTAAPAPSIKTGLAPRDLPVSSVQAPAPSHEPPSLGSAGVATAQMFASGNGGARTSAQPVYLSNPSPAYPMTAREKGQQGRVLLRVTIDEKGAVDAIKVKQGSGYKILDDSALSAVKRWKFSPATVGGMKVQDTIDLPIVFSLTGK